MHETERSFTSGRFLRRVDRKRKGQALRWWCFPGCSFYRGEKERDKS